MRMDDVWDWATTVCDCLRSDWDGTQALLLPWQHKKTDDTPLPHPPHNFLMKSLHAGPLSEDQQTAQPQITNWLNAAMRHCPHGSTCADGKVLHGKGKLLPHTVERHPSQPSEQGRCPTAAKHITIPNIVPFWLNLAIVIEIDFFMCAITAKSSAYI